MEKYVYGNGLISSEKTEGTVENSNTADAKTDSTKTETAGTLTVYHCDLRGSVRTVTDQTGTVTDRYSYSLYGERTHDTGDGDHIFGYCGRDGVITERDGLLYMRARYYSPELKRFISADSVIGNLSSTPSLNRYAYANGNPVTQIDPFGLSAEPGTKKAKKNINWREAVHDALDIAGSITGYGDICDAVNAVLYLTEGDYINAGLSALSIIPGADAFTKTGKASKVLGNGIVESGLKHLDNVADGIKKLVKKADDAIDLEKHLPKKLLTEEAETFAKKADKVADDVVEDAAKAIKSGKTTIDDLLKGLDETTNGKGVARNFESTGGYDQTLKDFDALNPSNVKDIQTKYGPGKVGTLSDGTKVVARQGSTTGGPTLEIKVSNSKVYKIRY